MAAARTTVCDLRLRSRLAPTPSALSLRMQGLRSTADKPAQQRIDPAAQSCHQASAIRITVATESCNVQRSHRFGCFAAGNARDALLIRTSASGGFSNLETHTLGSSQSLIPQLQIGDLRLLHRANQLASNLIRIQGLVWKSLPDRHRRPPSKNGAAGAADDDERTTIRSPRERSELRSSSKSLQAQ